MRLGGFLLFLAVFLSVYGGMHYYIYKKVEPLLTTTQGYVTWVFVLLVMMPLITQLMVHANWIGAARVAAGLGYTWMGFAFLFFWFALINDVLRGLLWLSSKADRFDTSPWLVLSSPQVTVAILVMALAACVYGAYAATQIHLTQVKVHTSKFAPGEATFRIVQISDLHLGLLTSEARVRQLVETINGLQPNLIVSTGDLIDMQTNHIGRFARTLRSLHATHGCYAVTGNHEAFAGLDAALTFTREAGFTLLSAQGQPVGNRLNLVGVDDPTVTRAAAQPPPPEASVLQQFDNGRMTILLKHQPVVNEASTPYLDLQLSGHVHGGQIFPFGLFTWLVYRADMGLSQVAPETWLNVTYGSGTWGPPIRFLAPPEIVIIDILPAPNADS